MAEETSITIVNCGRNKETPTVFQRSRLCVFFANDNGLSWADQPALKEITETRFQCFCHKCSFHSTGSECEGVLKPLKIAVLDVSNGSMKTIGI